MKSLKITFISLGAYPLFNNKVKATFGGAEVQIYLLAKFLAKDKKFRVQVLVGDYGQKKEELQGNIKLIRLTKNPIFRALTFFPQNKVNFVYQLIKLNSDVYIQRSASAGTGIICLVSKLMRKKFIYMTAHDIDCNGQFEKSNNIFTSWLFRYGIRNADLVITQSKRHAKMLNNHHKIDSKILGSSYRISKKNSIDIKHKKGVLWVARCEDWKQPEIFIDLASKLPSLQFTMICPRSNNQPKYFNYIRKKTDEHPNIKFIKYVPYGEIDRYFRKAKIFVNTSVQEGFPNTYVQALKNGTPVVSFSVNPDNFLHKYKCGFEVGKDLTELTNKIQVLMLDTKLYLNYVKNAYSYASKFHDIDINIQKFKVLVQKI